jgi:hypothetical protein
MRIREENRNMVLLGAVTLCCAAVSGTLALLGPAFWPESTAQSTTASRFVTVATQEEPVRVVGSPFVPNVDPHRR